MNTKLITAIIVVACTVGLIGWDIFVASNGIPGDTISEVLLNFVWGHPFLTFAWGVLTGHLFWPMRYAPDCEMWLLYGLIGLGVVLLVLDLCKVLPLVLPVWYVLPGIIGGHFCWAQPIPRRARD